ncbi:ABC-2 type transport system permease protein [Actinocorallia herbida]|uniref:Transport permease protein n=1 Tax=Actinocorallia herbida TaxID=58109 RepID=A0A3N1D4E4_9ACTN|nr:ABC transporter permease [Actinocorallia herbida]ROO88413.1 ABC-2 type transport system permease protein [Actinocorallia herbida]
MTAMTVEARALLADSRTLAGRQLLHWRNRPGAKVFGWLFPVLLMGMFTALLGGAVGGATGGSYLEFVMPGVLTMTVFFGLEGTMLGVASDAARGVSDRLRSLPVSGLAVVAGRSAADLLDSVIAVAVVTATGLAFGWRPDTSWGAVAAAAGLLLLLRAAMLSAGVWLGLRAGDPQTVQTVQVAVWPVLFLSGVFIDTATMPGWLAAVADANPLSATAAALRDLLGAPAAGGTSWSADHAGVLAVVGPVALTALFAPLAATAWRASSR